MKEVIQKNDIVLHTPSGLYYMCENNKHVVWMNDSPYYIKQPKDIVPIEYFKNSSKR